MLRSFIKFILQYRPYLLLNYEITLNMNIEHFQESKLAAVAILDIGSLATFNLCGIHMYVIRQVGCFECAKVIYHIHCTIQTISAAYILHYVHSATFCLSIPRSGGPGAVVKLPAWKVGDRGFDPHSGL